LRDEIRRIEKFYVWDAKKERTPVRSF
jgi:hypothetical protein